MSVLITGVDMPSFGEGNELIVRVLPNGAVLDEHRISLNAKAVPVPPHGRLGDLNALAQQIEHERFHHTHTDSLAARHHVAEYGHFLKAIIDAPTIIPASEEGE